jgi:hypothetical protein
VSLTGVEVIQYALRYLCLIHYAVVPKPQNASANAHADSVCTTDQPGLAVTRQLLTDDILVHAVYITEHRPRRRASSSPCARFINSSTLSSTYVAPWDWLQAPGFD